MSQVLTNEGYERQLESSPDGRGTSQMEQKENLNLLFWTKHSSKNLTFPLQSYYPCPPLNSRSNDTLPHLLLDHNLQSPTSPNSVRRINILTVLRVKRINHKSKKADTPPAIVLPMPPTQLKVKCHPTPHPLGPEPAVLGYTRFRARD